MQNFIRVSIADTAEQPGIGECPLQSMIFTCQCFTKVFQLGMKHVERPAIERRERVFALDKMQGCAFLGARFGQKQRP